MAWYTDNPALLIEELDALKSSGLEYEIDEDARSNGSMVIKVQYPIGAEIHILTCHYPAAYPYFSVDVFGPTMPHGRHLDPYGYKLCLFEDDLSAWDPQRDTLASALTEQIPYILKAHEQPEDASENEGKVGYQITGQILYEIPSVIFVEDDVLPDAPSFGNMSLRINKAHDVKTTVFGYVENIYHDGSIISKSVNSLGKTYPHKLQARWVKLNKPPDSIRGDEILSEAISVCPKIRTPIFSYKDIDIIGLVFPEESEYLKKTWNWIFVIRRRTKISKNKKGIKIAVIRSDRFNKENIQKRIPRLEPLNNKNILIVGAGALGSHIVWQLARAGIKSITIIDYDIVQVGNIPRWLLGFSTVGYLKVSVLHGFLTHNYPDITCTPVAFRIGHNQQIPIDGTSLNEHEFLTKCINESDLVIDAAAESNISLYLSNLCHNISTPYVWATGTQGGWGGIVGRVVPQVTEGTWTDFSYQYAEGKIPSPPAEEGSDIQPVGCFHPTFTGTGFDMDEISIMAVRLSIVTLINNETNGYPDFDWDIGILNLWNEATRLPIAPKWKTIKLVPNTNAKDKNE